MAMKATTPAQLKRVLKLYHDQLERDGDNSKSMIPNEFKHLIEKDHQIEILAQKMQPFRKAVTHVSYQNKDEEAVGEELKSTIVDTPHRKHSSFSRYKNNISNSLKAFWGLDKEDRRIKNMQNFNEIGYELKELDRQTNYSNMVNRSLNKSLINHTEFEDNNLRKSITFPQTTQNAYDEDVKKNSSDLSLIDSCKKNASEDQNMNSPNPRDRSKN